MTDSVVVAIKCCWEIQNDIQWRGIPHSNQSNIMQIGKKHKVTRIAFALTGFRLPAPHAVSRMRIRLRNAPVWPLLKQVNVCITLYIVSHSTLVIFAIIKQPSPNNMLVTGLRTGLGLCYIKTVVACNEIPLVPMLVNLFLATI